MPALAAAVRVPVAYVEIDVRTTADGVPVVIHDPTVDRTTDGTGQVAGMTLAQVRALDAGGWFSPGYAGQRVPTLQEALDLLGPAPVRLMVEIKRPSTTEQTKAVLAALLERGLTGRVVLQSFGADILTDTRDIAPELSRALLCKELADDPVGLTRELGVELINPGWRYLLDRPAVIPELQAAGVGVMPWTVDEPAAWQRLTEAGVAGIITNRPAELTGWLRSAALPTPRTSPHPPH